MKHVLVLDTIPDKQRNRRPMDAKRTWAACKYWLKEIQGLHTKHKNHNHIHSFDHDVLSCVKYRANEWTAHEACTHKTYTPWGNNWAFNHKSNAQMVCWGSSVWWAILRSASCRLIKGDWLWSTWIDHIQFFVGETMSNIDTIETKCRSIFWSLIYSCIVFIVFSAIFYISLNSIIEKNSSFRVSHGVHFGITGFWLLSFLWVVGSFARLIWFLIQRDFLGQPSKVNKRTNRKTN